MTIMTTQVIDGVLNFDDFYDPAVMAQMIAEHGVSDDMLGGHLDIESALADVIGEMAPPDANDTIVSDGEIDGDGGGVEPTAPETITPSAAALTHWSIGAFRGCEIIKAREDALTMHFGAFSDRTHIAMIEIDGNVRFVHPHKDDDFKGQLLNLDPATDIPKFPIAQQRFQPIIDISHAHSVHPCTGVIVEKDRALRAPVPGWSVRLRRMWTLGINFGSPPQHESCLFCERPANLFTCPLCLCTMHSSCAANVASHSMFKSHEVSLPPFRLSELSRWRDPGGRARRLCMCELCWSRVSQRPTP